MGRDGSRLDLGGRRALVAHSGPRGRGVRGRRLQFRPDQRHAHRLHGRGEQGRDAHPPGGDHRGQRVADAARVRPPHRRPHPRPEAGSVRRRGRAPEDREDGSRLLRAGRERRLPGRRQGVPRPLRQGHGRRQGLAELRLPRCPLHRAGQRADVQGGRPGESRSGAARMARGRRAGAAEQHAGRGLRSRAPLGRLSCVGVGDGRQRAGARLPQAVRLGDRAERPHSPDHAEDRGRHHVPHRDVHGVPPAGARNRARARPHEGPTGPPPPRARAPRGDATLFEPSSP